MAILESTISSLRVKFLYLVYRLLGAAAMPLFLLYAAKRVWQDRRYARGLGERFGLLPPDIFGTRPGGIWLHAVSVGEVLSAIALLRELRTRLPETAFWVSVATLSGRELADQRLQGLADGVFFAPLDSVVILRRVIRRLNPALYINLETEIWPNRLRELKRAGAMVAQVNARISDQAWPAYLRWKGLWALVLGHIDWLAAQSPTDAARFRELGYTGPFEEPGNLKFDFNPSAKPVTADLARFLDLWCSRPLWIAASTVGATAPDDLDEEDAVLDAFAQLGHQVRLLLAPRKPERFALVAEKLRARGLAFHLRSALPESATAGILLLDTIGELSALFPRASVVFVGGSLCRWGGHNILEPAYFARPILTGPHMQNFAAIQALFRKAQAVEVVEAPDQLAARVHALMEDDQGLGERAGRLAQSLQGVSRRLAERLLPLLEQGVPRAALPLAGWTRPLTAPWIWASRRPRTPQRLPATVVSIGNLSMGGTGKTPTTLALAEALWHQGYRVAILSRGYRRASQHDVLLLPGERAELAQTGDEAQLYLASGRFAVGIGADRHRIGQKLLNRFEADVVLLDDGFQHRRLARDFDLVLIDCTLPFPGFSVPPAGLLREPLSALERADAFLLTRAEVGRHYMGLRQMLPAGKPVYVAEESLRLARELDDPDLLAFCGIGNPAGFRQSLARLGLGQLPVQVFPDHHVYSEAEQSALRGRARLLITTAKDAVKWPSEEGLVVLEQRLKLPQALLALILEKALLTSPRAK